MRQNNTIKTIKIKELGEITELQPKVSLKDFKIPEGFRLLQFWEFSLLCELYPELGVGNKIEWVKINDRVASLKSYWDLDYNGLDVYGDLWIDEDGYALGVRFIKVKNDK